eukprot:Seg8802.1 transcript_id=Seg8802.1/GoldUCD/mRNA.D3Y31 product="putative peptide chain release factor C12orf65-like mitochondrial" protein_id=Seg8802.1/GoldUCD/D3Y31
MNFSMFMNFGARSLIRLPTTKALHRTRCVWNSNSGENGPNAPKDDDGPTRPKQMPFEWKDKENQGLLIESEIEESFIKGSGPGGQSVNKSSNCVQLKHLPTGMVIKCHQTRSLFENRKLARQLLYEKLEYIKKGDDSKLGKEIQEKKKKSTQNQRRQRLREQAKANSFTLEKMTDKDET